MFIENIYKFLWLYKNLSKEEFLSILKSNDWSWFATHKFEKDFLLTLILIFIWKKYYNLVFKWWTFLNKIYFPYFRLSEDLDFVIDIESWRNKRQKIFKDYENNLKNDLWLLWLQMKEWRTKFDEHRMAIFEFEYNSILDNSIQTIKIDISMKKLFLDPFLWEIRAIYKDPIFEESFFWQHYISCINFYEAVAEKLRASLTRKEPAIRDFFDIWYIKNNTDFDFYNLKFKELLDIKLKEVNYKYTIQWNYENLFKQIKTDLNPVLHKKYNFDFKWIYDFIFKFSI